MVSQLAISIFLDIQADIKVYETFTNTKFDRRVCNFSSIVLKEDL